MIIFDLDSTLRNVACSQHIIPQDMTISENWVEWQKHVNENATPNLVDVQLYEHLHEHNETMIVTSSMFGTVEWLMNNGIELPSDGIVERDKYDNLSPEEYKKCWITRNRPIIDMWVDDNEVVCEFAREIGITTVQVSG